MDDFLHNLRSGKLKQPDRGRRDYTDYKGPQRRAGNDRRRTDYYAKVTNENFALIKETLDVLAGHQGRIAAAMEARGKIEERIANALERLTQLMSGNAARKPEVVADEETAEQIAAPADTELAKQDAAGVDKTPDQILHRIASQGSGKLDEGKGPELIGAIAAMRAQGISWEKIARQFDETGVPTISGKGKWRGPSIKKFWDANSA